MLETISEDKCYLFTLSYSHIILIKFTRL